MNYNQNASKQGCNSASRISHPASPGGCDTAPKREPRSLDELVGNVVSYVEEINSTRAQAAAIRERLAGAWPESIGSTGSAGEPGLLGALGQFQGQAWSALFELREHLNAIQRSLG